MIMLESLPIETLQSYWWIILSVIGGLLVFMMFVQGGQTLIFTLGKTETERKLLFKALGRSGFVTFASLVIFGGVSFAAFPLFGITSFAGAWRVWALILASFFIQAVACEFRNSPNTFAGQKMHELILIVNGFVGAFLIGLVIATFFTGSAFSVSKSVSAGIPVQVTVNWEHPAHGLGAIMIWRNMALGLAFFLLTRVVGRR